MRAFNATIAGVVKGLVSGLANDVVTKVVIGVVAAALVFATGCATDLSDPYSATSTATSTPVALSTNADIPAPPLALQAQVKSVVDGDTIRVDFEGSTEIVRLLGIDTPEKSGGPRPAECFGEAATNFTQSLLPSGTWVMLSGDSEKRDQYGRLLAFVHRQDGLFVNLAVLEQGYGTSLFFSPNTALESDFVEAEHLARRKWRGFWPECGSADKVLQPDSATHNSEPATR